MSFFSSAFNRLNVAQATAASKAVLWRSATRSFASYSPPFGQQYDNAGPLRAQPNYSVFAEKCVMSMRLIPPQFRILRNNTMILDNSKRGRVLLEFAPRSPEGTVSREKRDVMRFALSAEEIGYLLHQLPENNVQFSRKTPMQRDPSAPLQAGEQDQTASENEPIKVFRMTPGEAGTVEFSVDYELNGQGGQQPSAGDTGTGPMAVTAELGEFQVIREIMRTTIPQLIGWSTMTDILMQRQFDYTLQNRDNYQSSGYGGGYGGSDGGSMY